MKPLVVMASLVVVIAGIKAAEAIVVPMLLAVFIAVICVPPTNYLERKGVPDGFSIAIVLVTVLALSFLLVSFLGTSISSFTRSLPAYETQLVEQVKKLTELLAGMGVNISSATIVENFDPGVAMRMVSRIFTSLSEILANLLLIILTVVFLLFEAASMPKKIVQAFGGSDAGIALNNFGKIAEAINKYLALKTVISLITGMIITIWLAIIGVDYPLLWGVVAFMLNYIPNIGSLIAAIPAVLLTVIQLGFFSTTLVAAGYLAVNVVMGSIVEPKLMGRGVGLSTLVVFLSLIFWGWVLGPVGMLLSVPLTMVGKIAFDSNESTRWIAVLLGPGLESHEPVLASGSQVAEAEEPAVADEAIPDADNAER